MHRRSFVLGSLALAPALVAAEGTPDASGSPAAVAMDALLFDVIADGRISRIPDLLAPSIDLDETMGDLAGLSEGLYLDDGYEFVPVMIAAEGPEAMAHVRIEGRGDSVRILFVYLHVNDDGLIDRITWSRSVI